MITAELARDEAIQRVDHSNEDWVIEVLGIIQLVARTQREFTTDHVWEWVTLGFEPTDRRAMGAVMTRAVKLGYCKTTDRTQKSTRVRCHARPLRVWYSLIYAG